MLAFQTQWFLTDTKEDISFRPPFGILRSLKYIYSNIQIILKMSISPLYSDKEVWCFHVTHYTLPLDLCFSQLVKWTGCMFTYHLNYKKFQLRVWVWWTHINKFGLIQLYVSLPVISHHFMPEKHVSQIPVHVLTSRIHTP